MYNRMYNRKSEHVTLLFGGIPEITFIIYDYLLHKSKRNSADELIESGALCMWDPTVLEFTNDTMDLAAEYGYLTLVQWLSTNRTEGCTTMAMDYASKNGHLAVVQWLSANRTEGCTKNAVNLAAANGHLAVVQWLLATVCKTEGCSSNALDLAAWKGHLAMVQWLSSNRKLPCTRNARALAAENGHFAVVQWISDNLTPFN